MKNGIEMCHIDQRRRISESPGDVRKLMKGKAFMIDTLLLQSDERLLRLYKSIKLAR